MASTQVPVLKHEASSSDVGADAHLDVEKKGAGAGAVASDADSAAHEAVDIDNEKYGDYIIDAAAERRLVRKVDMCILPALWTCYLLTFLDRTNLGNAKVAGLEASLRLRTYDFNIGACLYYIVYLCCDIPCGLLIKRVGFWILPAATLSFGIVTLGTAWITNRGEFFLMRCLLGLTESCSMPGCAYMLSRYYRRKELTLRVGLFMLFSGGTSSAFGGLLCSGFLSVDPIANLNAKWRNIFFCEGIITIGIAVTMFFWFPTDPTKTKIFNEEERKLWEARYFADQPAVTNPKEAATFKLIKRALSAPITVMCIWIYTCNNMSVQGLSIFTVTILRSIYPGKTTVQIQLLSIPPPVVAVAFSLAMCYGAIKLRRHGYFVMFACVVTITGYAMWLSYTHTPKVRYAALFLATMGCFAFGPITLGWAISNASPDTIRSVTAAAVPGISAFGSIASTWSYINTDAHTGYRIGNGLNIATASSAFITAFALIMYIKWENRQRDLGKRDHRLKEPNVDLLGNRHPQFRYVS